MKVVINDRAGGFALSNEAFKMLINLGWAVSSFDSPKEETKIIQYPSPRAGSCYHLRNEYSPEIRSNPELIKVVEKLGLQANGDCASLKIIEIPDDIQWNICEDHGAEWVEEKHRTWD